MPAPRRTTPYTLPGRGRAIRPSNSRSGAPSSTHANKTGSSPARPTGGGLPQLHQADVHPVRPQSSSPVTARWSDPTGRARCPGSPPPGGRRTEPRGGSCALRTGRCRQLPRRGRRLPPRLRARWRRSNADPTSTVPLTERVLSRGRARRGADMCQARDARRVPSTGSRSTAPPVAPALPTRAAGLRGPLERPGKKIGRGGLGPSRAWRGCQGHATGGAPTHRPGSSQTTGPACPRVTRQNAPSPSQFCTLV